jgi:hypothetical protein
LPTSGKRVEEGTIRGLFKERALLIISTFSGSGRVDYICMEPNGRATAWLRDSANNWFNAGQIKYQEGLDRANYRFADVNGKSKHPDSFLVKPPLPLVPH